MSDTEELPSAYDYRAIETYIEHMRGAKFIQPPQPAGHWEAPCDAPRCEQGSVRMYDMHGGYEASCSKCNGSGWITQRSLSRWLEKQERGYY